MLSHVEFLQYPYCKCHITILFPYNIRRDFSCIHSRCVCVRFSAIATLHCGIRNKHYIKIPASKSPIICVHARAYIFITYITYVCFFLIARTCKDFISTAQKEAFHTQNASVRIVRGPRNGNIISTYYRVWWSLLCDAVKIMKWLEVLQPKPEPIWSVVRICNQ